MCGTKNSIDWKYIWQHTDSRNYTIPYFYDTQSWEVGKTYSIRIANTYDPSKFWTVFYERELTLFHEFLNNFYNNNGEDYKMPEQMVKRFKYCVAFTDGEYYRGLIVDIPFFGRVDSKVSVFLFDFGFSAVVPSSSLYYLSGKMFGVPQFSVRSCLYGLEPYNTDTWKQNEVERFIELTNKKRLLCVLEQTDPSRKLVYITIDNFVEVSRNKTIRDIMIDEKLADSTCLESRKNKIVKKRFKFEPKNKYPSLFPSFEAIERAEVPTSVYSSEVLKSCVTAGIILYKNYYTFNGISVE